MTHASTHTSDTRTSLLVVTLVALALGTSCGRDFAPTTEGHDKSLDVIERDFASLDARLASSAAAIAPLTMATSDEQTAVADKLAAFRGDFAGKWAALDTPVVDATRARDEAKDALGRVLAQVRLHDTNNRQAKVWCGTDGCGATCVDACADDEVCFHDHCSCVPDCNGRGCGSDGCGGFCGTHEGACADGEVCLEDGSCVAATMVDVACEPGCQNGGKPLVEAGKRAAPARDFRPAAWAVRNAGEMVASVDDLAAWVRALQEREASLVAATAQFNEAETQLTDAQKARDDAQQALVEAQQREKAALFAAFRAKTKPADFPDAVKAKEDVAKLQEALKTAGAAVAALSTTIARGRADANSRDEGLDAIRDELTRTRPILDDASKAAGALEQAEAALAGATRARDLARDALLSSSRPQLDELQTALTNALQHVLRPTDESLLGCSTTSCDFAHSTRSDTCRGEEGPLGCPDGDGAQALLKRVETALRAREKLLEVRAKAASLDDARKKLDDAIATALRRVIALSSDDDEVARALLLVASERTDVGGISERALQALQGASDKAPEDNPHVEAARAIVALAKAAPSSSPVEREMQGLARFAAALRDTIALHDTRSHVVKAQRDARNAL